MVPGIPRKHAHSVPTTTIARVRLRNFCFRKRPSFLVSQRFAKENPTPCSNDLFEFNRVKEKNPLMWSME